MAWCRAAWYGTLARWHLLINVEYGEGQVSLVGLWVPAERLCVLPPLEPPDPLHRDAPDPSLRRERKGVGHVAALCVRMDTEAGAGPYCAVGKALLLVVGQHTRTFLDSHCSSSSLDDRRK